MGDHVRPLPPIVSHFPGEVRWGFRPPAQSEATRTADAAEPGLQDETPVAGTASDLEDAVQGVPMRDAGLGRAVQRVVILAAVGATWWTGTFIWRLLMGMYGNPGDGAPTNALWSGFSQLAIELSIPACGYYGALYSHRTLVFFFCGANLIFVVGSLIQFFRLLVSLGGGSNDCTQERYSSAQSTCEFLHGSGVQRFVVPIGVVVLTCFGCLSFGAGKKLYQGLGPNDRNRLAPVLAPIVGEVVTSSPNSGRSMTTTWQPDPVPLSTQPPPPLVLPVVVRASGGSRAREVAPATAPDEAPQESPPEA